MTFVRSITTLLLVAASTCSLPLGWGSFSLGLGAADDEFAATAGLHAHIQHRRFVGKISLSHTRESEIFVLFSSISPLIRFDDVAVMAGGSVIGNEWVNVCILGGVTWFSGVKRGSLAYRDEGFFSESYYTKDWFDSFGSAFEMQLVFRKHPVIGFGPILRSSISKEMYRLSLSIAVMAGQLKSIPKVAKQ
jgi:hypothetical protein